MMKVNKIFGVFSILIGGVIDIWILFAAFFIDLFSHPGSMYRIGLFVCYILLIVAGILLLLKRKTSIFLYLLFSLCLILDRYIFYINFWDDITLISEIFTPILTLIPVLIFLLYFHLKKAHLILKAYDFE